MGAGKSAPQAAPAQTIATGQGAIQCVCFDGTGRVLSGGDDGSVKVFDPSGEVVVCLSGHEGPVLCARFGAGGRLCSGQPDSAAHSAPRGARARVRAYVREREPASEPHQSATPSGNP